MPRKQNSRRAGIVAFGFLKHRKLIGIYGLVAVNARLQMPAGKIAAKGSRKSSRAESANRRTLPISVINVAAIERGLACPAIFQGLANRSLPRSFGDLIGERSRRASQKQTCPQQRDDSPTKHGRPPQKNAVRATLLLIMAAAAAKQQV
jgi:hypothetical protein